MKGRQKAMVLGAFLCALGTQAAWADDDNRAVPRDGGSDGGSSVGASHHSSGGSGWESSGSSSSSYGSDSSSYAASASFADDNRAVPRGGGSGGGSSAGSSHHSSGGSSSSSSTSGDSSSSSGSGHHSRPPQTDAQRRKPTPGTGTGYRYHDGYYPYYGYPYYGYGYPYYGWNYGYYWSPWYYPSYGWYGGYGGYGAGPGYASEGPRHEGGGGLLRVMVMPSKTKVYVNDRYVGVAGNLDGMFEPLSLPAGRHDITLKLEGYETHKVKVYVPLAQTLKLKYDMVKGSPEKVSESTVGDPIDEARYSRDPEDDYENTREHRDETRPDNRGERGTVRLDVSPEDASIYVDGVFRGTGLDLRKVTLPEGRHRLEVVRPGYRTLERDLDVTAGEVEEVDVDLPRS